MKRNLIVKSIVVSSVLSALLTGCGSTASDDTNDNTVDTQQTSISGKAIDGYLKNAVVCLDLNNDGYCQASSEPLTTTLTDGSFKLEITQAQRDNANFDEAMLLIFGGVDVDTGKDFTGKLMAPNDGSALLNVSPITTIVAKNVQKALKAERNLTKEQIKAKIKDARKKVADALEIKEEEVGHDPVARKAAGDDRLIRKALQVQKSIEALLLAAQVSDRDANDKMEDIYASLADGLDDMNGEKGLEKLFEKAAEKDLFQATLPGQSSADMLLIAKRISDNLDLAFEKIEDGDLEKIAAITQDNLDEIEEGAQGGDLSTAIEGIVFSSEDDRFKPEFDWTKKYITQDLLAIGIEPTVALVNKLKAVYTNEVRAGVLLEKSERLKDNADAELKAIYTRILFLKEKAEKAKEAEEAKYSDDIVKIETPMSIYNLSHHDNGYEKVTFTADNKLTFNEYRFDTESGTFVENVDENPNTDYVLIEGTWTNVAGDMDISIDKKGIVSLPSYGQTAALTREKDLTRETFFATFLENRVVMPAGAKGYMVKIEQVKDNYELAEPIENFNSIGELITGQCGDKWFDSFDNGDFTGGLSFAGERGTDGQYTCDPTKTEGKLSEVVSTSNGTKVREDAGSWEIITLPETNQQALVVKPYNDRYSDDNKERTFFTMFDDGSGSKLWRGEFQEKGNTFAFATMNKIAMDTLITDTINAFENGTLTNPFEKPVTVRPTPDTPSAGIAQVFELNGLTWTQVAPTRVNATEAAAMCHNIGWRLPTIEELEETPATIRTSGILLNEAQNSIVWSSSTIDGVQGMGSNYGFWFDPAQNEKSLQANTQNYYVTCVK